MLGIKLMMKAKSALIIILILSIQGCSSPWAIGAAAIGAGLGFYAGRDYRDTQRIWKDTNISAEINTAYFRAPDIDPMQINIYTYNGVVTLSGKVPSGGVAQRAIQIAQGTRGVTTVISNLEIVPPMS